MFIEKKIKIAAAGRSDRSAAKGIEEKDAAHATQERPAACPKGSHGVRLCEEEEIRAWCRRVTASNGFADFP